MVIANPIEHNSHFSFLGIIINKLEVLKQENEIYFGLIFTNISQYMIR